MNNAFPVFALLLWVVAAAMMIWLPRIWRRGGAPETNEDWLRLRQRELAGEAEAAELREEAALRLLEDQAGEAPPEKSQRPIVFRSRAACCRRGGRDCGLADVPDAGRLGGCSNC